MQFSEKDGFINIIIHKRKTTQSIKSIVSKSLISVHLKVLPLKNNKQTKFTSWFWLEFKWAKCDYKNYD